MLAPRARQHHDENAAAGLAPTRTPGPSRSRVTLSPVKGHATTGGKLQRTAPAPTSVSPKKLFGNATPGTSKLGGGGGAGGRFALGDKTNNKQRQAAPPNGAGSPAKGGASTSPAKSPTKSIRRPPTTPAADRSYATSGSASGTIAKGKQPAVLPLQTPAANIGRRGMMKQRMGELMDAQRAASGGGGGGEDGSARQGVEEDLQGGPALDDPYGLANLTEEERYPEIEYMPPPLSPSVVAQDYGFDARPEFSGLPRGKELAQMGAGARFGVAHLCRGEEREGSGVEVPLFEEKTVGVAPSKQELVKSIERDEQEDEERYLGKKKVVAAAPGVPRRAQVAGVSSRPAAVRTGSTTSAGSSARGPAGAASMRKPVAPATGSRPTTAATSRPAAVSRPGVNASNTAARPTTTNVRRPAPSSTVSTIRPSPATTTSKTSTTSSNSSARPLQRTTTTGTSVSQRSSATAPSTAAFSPQKDALSQFVEEQLHAGLLDEEGDVQGLDLGDDEEEEVREDSTATVDAPATSNNEVEELPQDGNGDASA